MSVLQLWNLHCDINAAVAKVCCQSYKILDLEVSVCHQSVAIVGSVQPLTTRVHNTMLPLGCVVLGHNMLFKCLLICQGLPSTYGA